MDKDTILGIFIIAFGLGFMTYLLIWSRRTIGRIAKKNSGSIREILKDLEHGK